MRDDDDKEKREMASEVFRVLDSFLILWICYVCLNRSRSANFMLILLLIYELLALIVLTVLFIFEYFLFLERNILRYMVEEMDNGFTGIKEM